MITSLLSQRKNGKNITYIKLIIYEVHLLRNAKNIKNIFPYIISIQFNQGSEKIISPIKNAKEIFKISNTNFKYFLRDKEKKIIIKINCFTKSSSIMKKLFASGLIEIENIYNINNNGKNLKTWYFLKNKNNEKILKILMSINLFFTKNNSNNLNNNTYTPYLRTIDLDSNITNNKQEKIDIHINSITNNNLNIISNNIFMTNFNCISSLNDSLDNINNNSLVRRNCDCKNLFTNILEKKGDNKENLNLKNNISFSIEKLLDKINKEFSLKVKNFNKQKLILENENKEIIQKEEDLIKEKNLLQNEEKVENDNRQNYENKYLDLNINYNELEKEIYRDDIMGDINNYEKEVLFDINNMMINYYNLYEKKLEKKLLNKEPGFDLFSIKKEKNSKSIEKVTQKNYFNRSRYILERKDNTKRSFYLYKKNSQHRILFNNTNIYNASINKENENNTNNDNNVISLTNLTLQMNKKRDNFDISKSKSNSSISESYGKRRFITDYSRSTLNIANDLYITDEFQIQEMSKIKPPKKKILSEGKFYNNKNKKRKIKTNINNEKTNYNKKTSSNLSLEKRKRKRVDINDNNEYYLYYNLESKNKEKKNKCSKGNININNPNVSVINQKTENNLIKTNKPTKNIKPTKNSNFFKSEKTFYIDNKANKKNPKNNQVFKNLFNFKKKNNVNTKTKFFKKEKICSIISFNNDNSMLNNSNLVLNSLLNSKKKSLEKTNSRNLNYIKYNANTNQNKNKLKTIENIKINLTKKLINKNKNNLSKNSIYIIDKNQKTKELNQKRNETNKNKSKIVEEKNKNKFPKINNNVLKKNLNKNQAIKKTNNSKNMMKILASGKTNDNSNNKNLYKKIPFYINKIKSLNSFQKHNTAKTKKFNHKIITFEDLNSNTQSNYSYSKKIKREINLLNQTTFN